MAARRRSSVLITSTLLLLACLDGPSEPRGEDPERLLTDAELVTVPDPAAASVDAAWDLWIQANHQVLRSLTSTSFDDLQFLKEAIGERRLVQLGESGHGVREFNLAKVRLIRFLHEEMGFDVIAFESGLFECWKADELAAGVPPVLTMRRCTFGVWHTEEVLALFEYIRQTRATARPLRLAGFDVQMSSGLGTAFAADFLEAVVGSVDPAYGADARALESSFYAEYVRAVTSATSSAIDDSIAAVDDREQFTARFDALRAFLEANEGALVAAMPGDPLAPLVARQLAFSRMQRIAQLRAAGTLASGEIRDRGMADNIDYLLDRMYPGQKVIAWAHNAHIMHDRDVVTPVVGTADYPESMGMWIALRRRAELYTIGLFMYRGIAANNTRVLYPIRAPLENSLEALFYRPRKRWIFVDMLSRTSEAGTAWMFGPIPAKEWGTTDVRVVPRDQFDGVLFIDAVSPPRYY
jgi:erythromycin esterase